MTGSRGLVIFGSTGSIGTQTLDVVRGGCGRYHVIGLTAHSNAELLAEQASEFRPRFVALSDQAGRERLQVLLERKGLQVPVVSDEELPSMLGTVSYDMSVVAAASVGLAGVVYDLLRSGLPMAIASKELLITLGDLLEPFRAQLRPIDSELSAIWQCLAGENPETVERVILTASGGPLRDLAPDELDGVTAAQALQHPSWRMGPKVTIDSATLFNKALELAEAHVLFRCGPDPHSGGPASPVHCAWACRVSRRHDTGNPVSPRHACCHRLRAVRAGQAAVCAGGASACGRPGGTEILSHRQQV